VKKDCHVEASRMQVLGIGSDGASVMLGHTRAVECLGVCVRYTRSSTASTALNSKLTTAAPWPPRERQIMQTNKIFPAVEHLGRTSVAPRSHLGRM
jgi:hypothetical protein